MEAYFYDFDGYLDFTRAILENQDKCIDTAGRIHNRIWSSKVCSFWSIEQSR